MFFSGYTFDTIVNFWDNIKRIVTFHGTRRLNTHKEDYSIKNLERSEMFRHRFLFVLLLLAGMEQFAAGEAEQWLNYHWAREARQIVGGMGSRDLELKTEKPAEVKMPEFKCENPYYVQWSSPLAKNGSIRIALDRRHKNGGYDLLYIDSNGDGHLNDETAVTAYQIEQNSSSFGPAKVTLIIEDEPIAYHLNFRFYNYEHYRKLRASSGGWYEGSIVVAGEKKHCVLIDQNANGTFDDKSIRFHKSDRVRIGKKPARNSRYVGNYIESDGKLYRLAIARDGAYVKLTPAEDAKFGDINLPECITSFAVGGKNGSFTRKMKNGTAKLPVGKYRLDHWTIDRKDEKGDKWKLKGRRFGDQGVFDVTESGPANLTVGEPVICTLTMKKKKNQYSFSHKLKGKLDERVEITRNGSRAKAPKLHIKCEEAEYDRTFTFEYG